MYPLDFQHLNRRNPDERQDKGTASDLDRETRRQRDKEKKQIVSFPGSQPEVIRAHNVGGIVSLSRCLLISLSHTGSTSLFWRLREEP